MATKIECDEHFPNYSPEQVFDVGTIFDTLPEGEAFELKPVNSDDVRFAEGVEVHLSLTAAGHNVGVDGVVTEFEGSKHLKIVGSAHLLGTAAVWFNLAPDEKRGGTAVDYGLEIVPIFAARLFVARVVAPQLRQLLPDYTEQYKRRVTDKLDQHYGRLSA